MFMNKSDEEDGKKKKIHFVHVVHTELKISSSFKNNIFLYFSNFILICFQHLQYEYKV